MPSSPPAEPLSVNGARSLLSSPKPFLPSLRPCPGRCIARVHPQVREAREPILHAPQKWLYAIPVHNPPVMDLGLQHQTLCVYQKVALAAFDLLASVVAPLFPAHAGGLNRPAVDYARAGLRVSTDTYAYPLAQRSVHPLPNAVD